MKTQKDLEKIQISSEQEDKHENETVALTLSPKLIIGAVIVIVIVLLAVFMMSSNTKRKRVSTNTTQDNEITEYVETEYVESPDSSQEELQAPEPDSENMGINQEEKYTLYENGELAQIEDPNGKFKFGVPEATILKEDGTRDAVYRITWVTENESYNSSLGTGTTPDNLRVIDSDGYVVSPMSEGNGGVEWVNWLEEDQPKPGEKCKTMFTFMINNPKCTYLDVSLDKYKVTCRVMISDLDNAVSSIPENATDREKEIIKAAMSYVDSCNMSYNGLIHQLEYEGYSHDEAVYGAENCGADWNEQAVITAKTYVSGGYYTTRDELIKQLEEGDLFTYDQAVYGADNCGKEW